MRKILFFVLITAFHAAFSQPNLVNYQGVLLGGSGVPMSNKAVRFRVTILDGNSISVASGIYSESHLVTTSNTGMFNFQIGGGTMENGNFSSIPWTNNLKYVKLEVDTNGGTNYRYFTTTQLVSVPFALAAGQSTTTSSIKDQNGNPVTVSTQNGTPTLVASSTGGSTLAGCGTDILYKDQYYSTVVIGGQCWMAENLNVGNMISPGTNQSNNGVFEKYCYNNEPSKCSQFGGLYQWAEAMDYKNSATNTTAPNPVFQDPVQGICPKGWRIPTYEDITTLTSQFPTNASASLRSSNNLWTNGPGTNETNFNFFPSGYTNGSSSTSLLTSGGFWYSHSANNSAISSYQLFFTTYGLTHQSPTKTQGYSVRCVKNACVDVQANAGLDIPPFCGDSIKLAAIDPGSGLKGRWTIKAANPSNGYGTFSNQNDPTSFFKGTRGFQYTLAWTVNGCSTSSDEVVVQFTSKADAGYDVSNRCDSSVSLQSNNKGIGETSQWSILSGSGGVFVNDSAYNTLFKGKLGTTYQLVWTMNSASGNCVTKDTVSIGFNPDIKTPVFAGNDQAGVILGDSISLNGSAKDSTEYASWSSDSYNFGFTSYGLPNTKAYAYNNYCSTAPVNFIWSVSNNCFTRRDTVQVSFVSPPKTMANVVDSITTTNRWVVLNGNTPNSREKVEWSNFNYGSNVRFFTSNGSWNYTSDSISPTVYIEGVHCDTTYQLIYKITNKACLDSTSSDTLKVRFKVSVNSPVLGADKMNISADTIKLVNSGSKNVAKPFYYQNVTWGSPEENYYWYNYVPTASTNPPLNTIGYPNSISTSNSPDSSVIRRACVANYYTILRVGNNYCTNSSMYRYDTILTNFAAAQSITNISSGSNQTVQVVNVTQLNGTKLPNPYSGQWTLVSRTPTTAGYNFSDYSQNNSLFTGEFGASYTLKWSSYNSCSLTNPTPTNVTITFSNPTLNASCPSGSTVTYDNRVYRTVLIGKQCWMKDDLNVGTTENIGYYPGSSVPWDTIVNKYCPNNDSSQCTDGAWYSWYEAVKNDSRLQSTDIYLNQKDLGFIRGICPTGWHIPSATEFGNLNRYLSSGFQDTTTVNNFSNASVFNRLLSGGNSGLDLGGSLYYGSNYYLNKNYYYGYGPYPYTGYNWQSNTYSSMYWMINYYNTDGNYFSNYNGTSYMNSMDKYNGLRVRCLKDW